MLKIGLILLYLSSFTFNCNGQVLIEYYTGVQKERERKEHKGKMSIVLKPRNKTLEIKRSGFLKDSIETKQILDIDTIFWHESSNELLEIKIITTDNDDIKLQYLLDKENSKLRESWQSRFHVIYSGEGVKIKIRNKFYLKNYLKNGG